MIARLKMKTFAIWQKDPSVVLFYYNFPVGKSDAFSQIYLL